MNNFKNHFTELNFFLKYNISFVVFYSPMLITKNKNLFKKIYYKSKISLPVNTNNPEFKYIRENYLKIKKIKFDYILAIGGGKTIDTAKLIKYLFFINKISKKLIVIPTLFGSGTETTDSAVYYINSIKFSKQSSIIQPNKIIYNFILAQQAPINFIINAALDCLCQSMESIWSKKCNNMSLKIATKSLNYSLIFLTKKTKRPNKKNFVLLAKASYFIGKAMNITRTTAPHALSYPLTAYLGIPHGLAVSLIMKKCIKKNLISIKDIKKINIFKKLFKVSNIIEIPKKYNSILNSINVDKKLKLDNKIINKLATQVDIDRLNNNPVFLNKKDIVEIYKKL